MERRTEACRTGTEAYTGFGKGKRTPETNAGI